MIKAIAFASPVTQPRDLCSAGGPNSREDERGKEKVRSERIPEKHPGGRVAWKSDCQRLDESA
jgi:hypothetical protein